MAATYPVKVTDVTHWNDKLFSFKTERAREFRFETGQFTMIGLTVDGKPLLRAYSIAIASYDDHLEFLSIKVPDGPLTSRLCNIQVGDEILLGKKPVGSLPVGRFASRKESLFILDRYRAGAVYGNYSGPGSV